jgi:hypothetical protein
MHHRRGVERPALVLVGILWLQTHIHAENGQCRIIDSKPVCTENVIQLQF